MRLELHVENRGRTAPGGPIRGEGHRLLGQLPGKVEKSETSALLGYEDDSVELFRKGSDARMGLV